MNQKRADLPRRESSDDNLLAGGLGRQTRAFLLLLLFVYTGENLDVRSIRSDDFVPELIESESVAALRLRRVRLTETFVIWIGVVMLTWYV